MKTFETAITISADIDVVWGVLTEKMPMNPVPYGIQRFDGAVSKDARIKIWSEVAPERAFALTVTMLDAPI